MILRGGKMYFLDTSAIIELINGTEKGEKIRKIVQQHPLSISSLTVHELLVGLKEKELKAMRDFFREVSVLDFNAAAAFNSSSIERDLRSKGNLINRMDILIAGICLVHKYKLIACDEDFTKIKSLDAKIV